MPKIPRGKQRKLKPADIESRFVGVDYEIRLPSADVLQRWERRKRLQAYREMLAFQVEQALNGLLTDQQLDQAKTNSSRPTEEEEADYARRFQIDPLKPENTVRQLPPLKAREYERISENLGVEFDPKTIQSEFLYLDPEAPLRPPVVRMDPDVLRDDLRQLREMLESFQHAVTQTLNGKASTQEAPKNGFDPELERQLLALQRQEQSLRSRVRRQKVLISAQLTPLRKERDQLAQITRGTTKTPLNAEQHDRYEYVCGEVRRLEGRIQELDQQLLDGKLEIDREIRKLKNPDTK